MGGWYQHRPGHLDGHADRDFGQPEAWVPRGHTGRPTIWRSIERRGDLHVSRASDLKQVLLNSQDVRAVELIVANTSDTDRSQAMHRSFFLVYPGPWDRSAKWVLPN